MNRKLGTLALAPLVAGLLFLGAGPALADADTGTIGDDGATSSAQSNTGSGNVFGENEGNYNASQQNATGSGATNQNNTANVQNEDGVVVVWQGNANAQYDGWWGAWH